MSTTRGIPDHIVYLTGHEKSTGKSIFLPKRNLDWDTSYDEGRMPMAPAYVNKNPADLNGDADLAYDKEVNSSKTGLAIAGGALARYVDVAPGSTTMMHRTQTLDYGIVVAGTAECVLDSGEVQRMKAGDVMVQRYTMHAWRNPDEKEWLRIFFVLIDCQPLTINGHKLGEDLGRGAAYLQNSSNA